MALGLDAALVGRVCARLEDDAAALASPDAVAGDPSLASGTAGLAVLFAHLARASGDDRHVATSESLLAHAVGAVRTTRMDTTLYGGFPGVAWAVQHVEALLHDAPRDRGRAIDDALVGRLERAPWPGSIDLINGLAGIGVYARERLPRPAAVRLLELVVDRLAERAERAAGAASWWSAHSDHAPEWREVYPPRFADVGMAHGVAAVLGVLGIAYAAGVERARPLVDDAFAWTLAQGLEHAGGRFPRWAAPDREPAPARTAWCYGDPGVAAGLLVAARAVGEPTWEEEAVATARLAAVRPQAETGVVDASLCHGAAGLAAIFTRFHEATEDAVFADAARDWLTRALDLPTDDAGVLTGRAGVALALLLAVSSHEPTWERLLLIA